MMQTKKTFERNAAITATNWKQTLQTTNPPPTPKKLQKSKTHQLQRERDIKLWLLEGELERPAQTDGRYE